MRRARRVGGVALVVAAFSATPLAAADLAPDITAPPHLGRCGLASGGFLMPGTEGCLTLGGFVRAEGTWSLATPRLAAVAPLATGRVRPPPAGGFDRFAFGTSARLAADMRLPTELGPLRVFVSLRGHHGVATNVTAR